MTTSRSGLSVIQLYWLDAQIKMNEINNAPTSVFSWLLRTKITNSPQFVSICFIFLMMKI